MQQRDDDDIVTLAWPQLARDSVGRSSDSLRVHSGSMHQHLQLGGAPWELSARQIRDRLLDPPRAQRSHGVGDVGDLTATRDRLGSAQHSDGQARVALDRGHELAATDAIGSGGGEYPFIRGRERGNDAELRDRADQTTPAGRLVSDV